MLVWAGSLCVCGLLAGAARGVWVVGALGPPGLLSPLLGSKKPPLCQNLPTHTKSVLWHRCACCGADGRW